MPEITVPTEYRAILNAHFRIAPPANLEKIIGVINSTTEWLFAFDDRVVRHGSATQIVSMKRSASRWRGKFGPRFENRWDEGRICRRWQIVKERRATFAATPAQNALRPRRETRWANLLLAGDWTATGLPATIEGSIRSGEEAAKLAMAAISDRTLGLRGVPQWNSIQRYERLICDAADAVREIAGSGAIDAAISAAKNALLALQRDDGHFVFELEADATIPAEYVLMRHYLGEPVDARSKRRSPAISAAFSRTTAAGRCFTTARSNISASVKAYFALKMIGVGVDEPHMKTARAHGSSSQGGAGAQQCFTRNLLALFGVIPWRGVPVMPVEIMLLPRWFPFHIDKISYWARTVLVPLTVLNALKPQGAQSERRRHRRACSVTPPERFAIGRRDRIRRFRGREIFGGIDRVLRAARTDISEVVAQDIDRQGRRVRHRAAQRRGWPRRDFSCDGQFGAVSTMRSDIRHDHPDYRTARGSIEKLLIVKDDEAYCQPCLSPVWDTALVAHALTEAGGEEAEASADRALGLAQAATGSGYRR